MRLTRKKAIELCIELWTWLAETGKYRREWPEWEKYGDILNYCWFCEYLDYRRRQNKETIYTVKLPCEKYCPWYKKYGACQTFMNNIGKETYYEKFGYKLNNSYWILYDT